MKKICKKCNKVFSKKYNESIMYFETKNFCSISCSKKGAKHSTETKQKMKVAGDKRYSAFSERQKQADRRIGKPSGALGKKWKQSEETLAKRRGSLNPAWKGGITPINKKIRNSQEYADWRTTVFKRDDYTCQECASRGYQLHADHIKPFAYYPELRLVIENGRTLCVPCHKKTETFAGRAKRKNLTITL